MKQLAAAIQQAQQPEIDQMNAMLRAWGVTAMPPSGMPSMDHGGVTGMGGGTTSTSAMPGMMSPAQLQQLDQATGAAFDRMFLQMMIEHHTGAITMSQTELVQGISGPAKPLAQRIIDAQRRDHHDATTARGVVTAGVVTAAGGPVTLTGSGPPAARPISPRRRSSCRPARCHSAGRRTAVSRM